MALTEAQDEALHNVYCDGPIPLAEADTSKPFIYDREYGFFYCPSGQHRCAMAVFLALKHSMTDGIDVSEKLGVSYSSGAADHYLENYPGTAFRSSVSRVVFAGKRGNLSPLELRRFGEVRYLFESEN